jgi:cytoskeletal protein CcmA (bactofilin family)
MLKNNNPPKANSEKYPAGSSQNVTRLGPTARFKGDLSASEDLIISGQFQGKIFLENHDLTIEQGARVTAEIIQVKNIEIRGTVDGNIQAKGRVVIAHNGQVNGDISASRISITEGAKFKGNVKVQASST